MNILIVKLSAIGDVIHTLPALACLRRCYPEAHITWVVEEAAADLLADHPHINQVLVSRRKGWVRDLRRGRIATPLKEMRQFLRQLRDRPYDLVIDFHGLFKSALLVLLSGGRRKLGYDSLQEGSGFFYTEKIPEDMGKHAVDRYLDFIRYLAKESGCGRKDGDCLWEAPLFTIAIGDGEKNRVAALLAEGEALFGAGNGEGTEGTSKAGVKGQSRLVAVNPIAFWETKLWEEGKFASLCDRLREELGVGIVLTGGEAASLERISRQMRTKVLSLGGRTTLRDLALLYSRAALVITTDSGPMHLAAAVGTPVVALFGPTDPARTGPYGPGHRVIRRTLPCMPCFKKHCETKNCMREIAVEEVFAAAKEMLGKKGEGK